MLTAPQRFALPFHVLLETVRGWHEPLTLSATLPHIQEDGTGNATAILHLLGGQVQSCTIVTAQGQLLARQQAALTRLRQAGNLEWLVTPEVAVTQVYRPCRRDPTRLVVPTTFSRRHRQLLLLVDGQKSIPDLARVLRLPPHEIESLLLDLQQQQFVV